MFIPDNTPWKMHISPSDLADRCFRVFCRWVILAMGREGGGLKKRKIAQNVLKHALVLEFLNSNKNFLFKGGGCLKKKKSWNVLKHALVLEFLKSEKKLFGGGGGATKKSCSECAETCSHFGFFEI